MTVVCLNNREPHDRFLMLRLTTVAYSCSQLLTKCTTLSTIARYVFHELSFSIIYTGVATLVRGFVRFFGMML